MDAMLYMLRDPVVIVTLATFAFAFAVFIHLRASAAERRDIERVYDRLRDELNLLHDTRCIRIHPRDPKLKIFGLMTVAYCPSELGGDERRRRLDAIHRAAKLFAISNGFSYTADKTRMIGKANYRILIGLRYPS